MIRRLGILGLFGIMLLAQQASAQKSGAKTVDFIQLRFFEGGYEAPDFEDRVYTAEFNQTNTRYVHSEVKVRNLRHGLGPNRVAAKFRYLKPDGSLLGNAEYTYTIPSEESEYYLWHSWGWAEAGNWTPGRYCVEVFLNGEYVAKDFFTIAGKASQTVEFKSLRFFEAPFEVPDFEDRVYSSEFSRVASRYVYSEIEVRNLRQGQGPNTVTVKYRYYKPDGSMFCDMDMTHTIPSEHREYYLWKGWGWPDPGNWEPGRYRVEISINGQYVGQNFFTITSTAGGKTSQTVEFKSVRFFEGPYATPAFEDRTYLSSFNRATTRYIHPEILVRNFLQGRSPNTISIRYRYFSPDGSLFGDDGWTHTIPSEHAEYYLWKGWGWSDPGNWTPGQYRVEISIEGNVVGTGYFTITGETERRDVEKKKS